MRDDRFDFKAAALWLCAVLTSAAAISEACWAGQAGSLPQPQTNSAAALAAQASPYFEQIYRDFYNTYRLGPGDEIAIRVAGQPDYSLDHVKVFPTGSIYHPLVGDIDVAGLTINELTRKLGTDFAEYLINPKVSVALLVAQSAKVGVLGEVVRPGIVIMTEPMTVLNAISASG